MVLLQCSTIGLLVIGRSFLNFLKFDPEKSWKIWLTNNSGSYIQLNKRVIVQADVFKINMTWCVCGGGS